MRWLITIISTVLITISIQADSIVPLNEANLLERVERCEFTLDKCARAYFDQKRYISNLQMTNELQSESINLLTQRVIDERAYSAKWYRQPEYLIPGSLVLGIVLGVWANK